MKNYASNSPRPLTRTLLSGSILTLCAMFMAACIGLLAPVARAQVYQLDVGVRSTVVDKPLAKPFAAKSDLPQAPEHGKIYGILAVQLIPAEEKVIKPVDAHKLMELVRHELDTHGFREVEKGRKPEILLTVAYGRAWLNNPYFGSAQANNGMSSATVNSNSGTGGQGGIFGQSAPTQNLDMSNIKVFSRLQEQGVEAKAQKAQFEKLCIKIIAWQYPTDPKAPPKQLWNTLMNVDDPDHRDLNEIAQKMLEAGAPYFDKEVKEEELDVYKPLPEGHVNVGTPEVIEPAASKTK
jgi:hypothetical protein